MTQVLPGIGAISGLLGSLDPHSFPLPASIGPVQSFGSGVRTCGFRLVNDGNVGFLTQGSFFDSGDWINPKDSFSDYDAIVTLTGDSVTGTVGSRVNLGTTQTWTLTSAVIGDTKSTELICSIYRTLALGGQQMGGSCTIQMECERS